MRMNRRGRSAGPSATTAQGEDQVMNELFEFLGTMRVFALAYLGVLVAVATGLAIFDRKSATSVQAIEATTERKAA